MRKVAERSYEVYCNGQVLRRNREHLRAAKERPPEAFFPVHTSPDAENPGDVEGATIGEKPLPASRSHLHSSMPSHEDLHGAAQGEASKTDHTPVDHPEPVRRSSRQVREPRKMKDFIRY